MAKIGLDGVIIKTESVKMDAGEKKYLSLSVMEKSAEKRKNGVQISPEKVKIINKYLFFSKIICSFVSETRREG